MVHPKPEEHLDLIAGTEMVIDAAAVLGGLTKSGLEEK